MVQLRNLQGWELVMSIRFHPTQAGCNLAKTHKITNYATSVESGINMSNSKPHYSSLLTVYMLTYQMLKYPLKCAKEMHIVVYISTTNDDRTMVEPC